MKNIIIQIVLLILIFLSSTALKKNANEGEYKSEYFRKLNEFADRQFHLLELIVNSDLQSENGKSKIRGQINVVRNSLKGLDFWMRYLEPVSYKKINGPLPVEWETEVFEKFEKPYRREGAGLTLAALYLEEDRVTKDSLLSLIKSSIEGSKAYKNDSITGHLETFSHFFLCNRLYLLNLAAIYTTGFECPDTEQIIPELRLMMKEVQGTYFAFNQSFSDYKLQDRYMNLYAEAVRFVNQQPDRYDLFDHYTFIKNFINPLFGLNQQFIGEYKVKSKSFVDYSLNDRSTSIFSKSLYRGQNVKGVFSRVHDERTLLEIENIGKSLFFDPILSGNNQRSCASCHKPESFFTDTALNTSLQFNRREKLPRNTPSLINAQFNHLLMSDGLHTSLQGQTKAVITNSIEMACAEKDIVKKVLSCNEYKKAFGSLVKYTPQEPAISIEHIVSSITYYYSRFSRYEAPFDLNMNKNQPLDDAAVKGFNLFMSKAQCATCHFIPQFNGVKPPYVSSEFEVLGVPADSAFKNISPDKGRFGVNPSKETLNAFRTGTLRNVRYTKPYMHNGILKDLDAVIDFYNAGGGQGKGLPVANQTLSSDSLRLTSQDKNNLLAFINSLNENIPAETAPPQLPASKIKALNVRKVRGTY